MDFGQIIVHVHIKFEMYFKIRLYIDLLEVAFVFNIIIIGSKKN